MLKGLSRFRASKRRRNRGAALIGYGLIIALLSVAAMSATSETGRYLAECIFPSVSAALQGEDFRCTDPTPSDPQAPDDEESDPWVELPPVYGVEPGTRVVSEPATVEGLKDPVWASASGPPGSSPELSVDGGPWTTGGQVYPDSSIRVRAFAPFSYNDRISIAIEMAGKTSTWRVGSGPEVGAPQWLREALPTGYTVLDYELAIRAKASSGTSISAYEFVEGSLPPGVVYDTADSSLSGRPEELGSYTFTLAVEDNEGRRNEREFTIRVSEAPPLASQTSPSRFSITRGSSDDVKNILMDANPDTATWPDGDIRITFDEPVLLDQYYYVADASSYPDVIVRVGGSDVVVGWIGKSSGSTVRLPIDKVHPVTSVRISLHYYFQATIGEFHFGTPNPPPSWQTPAGSIAIVNGTPQEIQLEASSRSPWVPEVVSFELSPGSTLPDGFELSESGLLRIPSDTQINQAHEFSVNVLDGTRMATERTFRLLPNLPLASEYPPDKITMTRGSSADVKQTLMDGNFNTRVTPQGGIRITFEEPVLLDQYHFAADARRYPDINVRSGGQLIRIGSISNSKGATRTFALNDMLVVTSIDITLHYYFDASIAEFHFGKHNPLPFWITTGTLMNVNGTPQTLQLEAGTASEWSKTLRFELAPDSTLPDGIDLSSGGLLTVSDGVVLTERYPFTVRVSDWLGFYRDRTFYLGAG